jgi:KDO2-lipid IV(A) lauroyltransferase
MLEFLGPHIKHTLKIERNLKQAFPELSQAELNAVVRMTWGNMGAVLAEYPHLGNIQSASKPPRIETLVSAEIESLRGRGQPMIFVTGHFGNWELAAAVAGGLVGSLSVIHTEQDNPFILSAIQRQRRALGCGFVSKEAGLRPILRLLDQGTSIGMLVDVKLESGEPLLFFGREALTTLNPAQLALRFHCPLVPIQVERLRDARFRVTVHKPVVPDDPQAHRHDQARQMMSQVNALFEAWIRQHPGQWWCSGNRWPKPGKTLPRNRKQRSN